MSEHIMRSPAVSIIMNCYNGERFLNEAIESVLAQTHSDWELIFWDNLSSDNSSAILKGYSDKRLRYFCSESHTNLGAARKLAYEECRGELIAFLDVDDTWEKEYLEKQVALFIDENIGFSCANYFIRNERNGTAVRTHEGTIPSGYVLDDLLGNYFIGLLTLVVRRAALERIGSINPNYHMIYDFDLAVKLSCEWMLASIQEPIATYRVHEDNESFSNANLNIAELKSWRDEMSTHKIIGCSKSFAAFEDKIHQTEGLKFIYEGSRFKGLTSILKSSFSIHMVSLIIATILPLALLKKLRSL